MAGARSAHRYYRSLLVTNNNFQESVIAHVKKHTSECEFVGVAYVQNLSTKEGCDTK